MVTHVENVNLSVIYRIWLTKCTFFVFAVRIRSCLFITRRIRSPSPGLPGAACHPASPYSCPCRRTVGRRAARAAWCGPVPGPDSCTGPCEECGPNLGLDPEVETGSDLGTNYCEFLRKKPQTQKDPPPFGNESFCLFLRSHGPV